MKFFVFVDMDYYPYVGEPVEADTLDDAYALAIEQERLSTGHRIYVAPMSEVREGVMHGPRTKPHPLIELMRRSNALMGDVIEAKNVGGFSAVTVEAGSMLKDSWGLDTRRRDA